MVRAVTLLHFAHASSESPVDFEAHFGIGTAGGRRLVDSAAPS